mmetsp:Transcript_135098/g.431719  ORF Transcript_135098/g.431719 Transcript_135098/m.431719 type:complete len:495 (+) Transcript_135098:873-2357(+)
MALQDIDDLRSELGLLPKVCSQKRYVARLTSAVHLPKLVLGHVADGSKKQDQALLRTPFLPAAATAAALCDSEIQAVRVSLVQQGSSRGAALGVLRDDACNVPTQRASARIKIDNFQARRGSGLEAMPEHPHDVELRRCWASLHEAGRDAQQARVFEKKHDLPDVVPSLAADAPKSRADDASHGVAAVRVRGRGIECVGAKRAEDRQEKHQAGVLAGLFVDLVIDSTLTSHLRQRLRIVLQASHSLGECEAFLPLQACSLTCADARLVSHTALPNRALGHLIQEAHGELPLSSLRTRCDDRIVARCVLMHLVACHLAEHAHSQLPLLACAACADACIVANRASLDPAADHLMQNAHCELPSVLVVASSNACAVNRLVDMNPACCAFPKQCQGYSPLLALLAGDNASAEGDLILVDSVARHVIIKSQCQLPLTAFLACLHAHVIAYDVCAQPDTRHLLQQSQSGLPLRPFLAHTDASTMNTNVGDDRRTLHVAQQ